MPWFTRLLGLVLGLLMIAPSPTYAETGSFQVTVNGVTHTISYQAFTDQQVNELRDPVRFRFREGVGVTLEVFDPSPIRIIEKVSVQVPSSPGKPEGADFDLPLTDLFPGDTGVDFSLGLVFPSPGDLGTLKFLIKLNTGDKIRIAPFPMTLHRLPDLQNVQFLDNTTKPVITYASLPGMHSYKVKVLDPETGLALFVTNPFPPAAGDIQTLDLKAPPTGGFPIGWAGMEIGKRYIIGIDGRLRGPSPIPQFITLPATAPLPGPPAGQGQITRSTRRVEYTPLELAQ